MPTPDYIAKIEDGFNKTRFVVILRYFKEDRLLEMLKIPMSGRRNRDVSSFRIIKQNVDPDFFFGIIAYYSNMKKLRFISATVNN